MTSRPVDSDTILSLVKEVKDLKKEISLLKNRKSTNLRFYDADHMPVGAEGDIVIGQALGDAPTTGIAGSNTQYSTPGSADLVVGAGAGANMSWASLGGTAILDLSIPSAPTIGIPGFYVFTALFSSTAVLTTGKSYYAGFNVGGNLGAAQECWQVTSATPPAEFLSFGGWAAMGDAVTFGIANRDTVTRNFSITVVIGGIPGT
jgi:hypothetical protein